MLEDVILCGVVLVLVLVFVIARRRWHQGAEFRARRREARRHKRVI